MAATAPLIRGISVDESELDDDGLTAQDRADLATLIKTESPVAPAGSRRAKPANRPEHGSSCNVWSSSAGAECACV